MNDCRCRPPGLTYYDKSAEQHSEEESSSDEDLENVPEILDIVGEVRIINAA